MKKLLFIPVVLIALFIALPAQADTRFAKQGTLTVGGLGGFDYESEEEVTTITFDPVITYFVIPGLAVGGEPKYQSGSPIEGVTNQYGLYAVARYYYALQGTMFLVGGVNLGYESATTTDVEILGVKTSTDSSGFGYGAHAGISIAFGNKFGGYVNILARYMALTLEDDNNHEAKTANMGLAAELGLFF